MYLIRHGETDWNRRKALQGRLNTPLNETGIAQARAACAKLADAGVVLDAVYSSPLQRALTTASIVSGLTPAQITKDDRLIEIAFGEWEGREMASVGALLTPFFHAPQNYMPPADGEELASLFRRTGDFLQMVCTKHPGKRVLAASHGAATAALLTQAQGLTLNELWKTPVHNCRIFKLTAVDGVWDRTVSVL